MDQKMKTNLARCFAAAGILLLGMAAGLASGQARAEGKARTQVHETAAGRRGKSMSPRLDPGSTTGGSDLVIKGGTWLSLTSGVKLSLGGNLSIGGAIAPSVGTTVIFNGRGPQTESGFAVFPDVMKTGGGMLTLNNPLVISGS